MAWYNDVSIYHHLQWGSEAAKIKRESQAKTQNMSKQFPRPTQESEKEHKPFSDVRPRNMPPPLLTQEANYQPVYSKKPSKNVAYNLAKKKT